MKYQQHNLSIVIYLILCLLLNNCTQQENNFQQKNTPLFESILPQNSGVHFVNSIKETPTRNYFTFWHMYIGAGVATADFNNDGLTDIYFIGNMSPNKLYLNKGDFKFEDITVKAGVSGNLGFYMGVTIADVNADGFMDIYLCKSGKYNDSRLKENLVFINNGDLTFTEKAKEYGINDANQSTQAAFFDYDGDDDLDLYVVNTPTNFSTAEQTFPEGEVQNDPYFRTLKGDDQLYRNDGDKFVNVTSASGILPDAAFGLNVSISDFNNDNHPDIFVSNDFMEPDYLYINNGDGTFSEETDNYFKHLSIYSMGSDPSDVNNDGFPDLIVLDMNPEDYMRSKTTMNMMDRKLFKNFTEAGYNHLYMHNMFHLNTGMNSFSEISQMSGISNTDWSWSCLVSDFDNDGLKDMHVTNGIYRDVLDRDKRNEIEALANQSKISLEEVFEHLKKLPSKKIPNYIYKNKNGYQFEKKTEDWGMKVPSFSNGSAVADFDNDGDLDIVINNLMDTAFVYKNNAEKLNKNYLKIRLKGPKKNTVGIGAKVYVKTNRHKQYQEVISTKGYLSASDPILHFGLDTIKIVKEVKVIWPNGKVTIQTNIPSNQLLTINYNNTVLPSQEKESNSKYISEQKNMFFPPLIHQENDFDDYEVQVLLPYKYSQLGPALAVEDINGDGLDDVFVGGAMQQLGSIYFQNKNCTFSRVSQKALEADKIYEDTGALFFDIDEDGDKDLYVASGGYEMWNKQDLLQDRLYINNGKGQFLKSENLPKIYDFTASVKASDIDLDGDLDLFVGGRMIPGKYPMLPQSYILINENGTFKDKSSQWLDKLQPIGLVTDSEWLDINNDTYPDLIVTGEWMSPSIYINKKGKHFTLKEQNTEEKLSGWWQSMLINDFTGNGKQDVLLGNLGLNSKYNAKHGNSFEVYASDFDGNNTVDAFLTKRVGNRKVPVRGKECSSEQIPGLKNKFPTFKEFANADISEILGSEINSALHLGANNFKTSFFEINNSSLEPTSKLPLEVQFSAVTASDYFDFNNDGLEDIILGGNIYNMEIETTRLDAGTGVILINKGNGEFAAAERKETGFYVPYDVKHIKVIRNMADGHPRILVISNNDEARIFKVISL